MIDLSRLARFGVQRAPVDLGEVPGPSDERRALYLAGMQSIMMAAGKRAEQAPAPNELAPLDDTRPLSPRAAALVTQMIQGTHADLLPEALQRMTRGRYHLPYAVLPGALAVEAHYVRERLRPVLGARGRWLAGFDPSFAWALEKRPDLRKMFEEGDRKQALAKKRAEDPAEARRWLEETWPKNKALLVTLKTGLSLADEPLLEKALDDRSREVRETAQLLLAMLPESALVRRMTARADVLLGEDDPQSVRDGLSGSRAEQLARAVSCVPLSHWEERFEATPAAIVKSVAQSPWRDALLQAWALSAAFHRSQAWIEALWEVTGDNDILAELARAMDDPTPRVAPLLATRPKVIAALPRPWSAALGHAFLDVHPPVLMRVAAHALPEACFERALEIDADDYFTETIRLRQALAQEIPP